MQLEHLGAESVEMKHARLFACFHVLQDPIQTRRYGWGNTTGSIANGQETKWQMTYSIISLVITTVLFEQYSYGQNGLVDSLRAIFNDYAYDNQRYVQMVVIFYIESCFNTD